ncbi:undecaprenyldiphospho-muramoylpentapeptide beta-N-acetylglucosaminyltransferase [Methyloligella sp. 2.7D]|uniref:undecaprenyldiphospho-muramoylpentapeptide beta-N-acetylglucosaminyltransferase n=1 Tax=unclassified Methyloligella TaxID=2625955 RepID=UPI00157DA4B4|nr:undecaprenyldiphospho-muramoylpentapeptide beta-N-acetylglucosaminyltransferase [Methyloligella sp. GL2]QKP77991.1 undecaprenyldiphospho-muramoylpentapeptide beta-N-acetylglucosaminyltransferase [Methyloligella sp. GL2]
MSEAPFLLAAGGTAGHLFPAAALAEELVRRGHPVELATDMRAEKYGGDFPGRAMHPLHSATLSGRNPIAIAKTFATLGRGYFEALALLTKMRPRAVIGFGGYPTLPPLIAARTLGIPSALHEQNAVMGRANRLLSKFASKVALTFPQTQAMSQAVEEKSTVTGTPVRDAVLAFRDMPYTPPESDGRLLLLVFGGSQGAHFFSEAMPAALPLLPEAIRARLTVVQQCRPEDLEAVKAAYAKAGIAAHLAPFFKDLPERIANSHLVIARAGASTVAEIAVIGRPGLLVPLPHALDNDQLRNATRLAEAGGGWCFPQSELSPERLAKELEALLSAPQRLADAAAAARAFGEPDAVEKLADFAEGLAASR